MLIIIIVNNKKQIRITLIMISIKMKFRALNRNIL